LSRYRFRHILYQKHLYNTLDSVERVHSHQAVGEALEALHAEAGGDIAAVAPHLARHFQEAGITEKAVGYLRQAGERAQRLYANAEAIEHFRQALAILRDAPAPEALTAWRREMKTQLHESLGDVLEWTGEHDKARAAYQGALHHAPRDDLVWQSHLQRKVGNIWRLQRQYEKALQAYDLAESALGEDAPDATPAWRQEWVQIQLERMWLHYWLGQWREISELADQVRPAVEQYGTPTQCISFFLSLATMFGRRDRYAGSEEALDLCQTALAIAVESKNASEIAWARFVLGFNQLWYGDLDAAERQMQAALAQAEESGDVVHQSRCLTYLTILYRKRRQLEKVRHYVSQSHGVATEGQMLEYIGMARAHQAWMAWCDGDLAQAEAKGQLALELWQQLPAAHSSCAFQWTALWPLIGAAVARHHPSQAINYARALLEPTQQCLPDRLTAALENVISAREDDEAAVGACLDQAVEVAQELGYL
jgi:tetratricopeptide (TPR) repeat protein